MLDLPIPIIVAVAVLVFGVFLWIKKKIKTLLAGVKEQLFTPESVIVSVIYFCFCVGVTGVVYGIKMYL